LFTITNRLIEASYYMMGIIKAFLMK